MQCFFLSILYSLVTIKMISLTMTMFMIVTMVGLKASNFVILSYLIFGAE